MFVGPIFIHHTKKKETYAVFREIENLALQIENLIAFCRDGEAALSDALTNNYPRAIHLQCFLHFRKNVESKLASLGVPDHQQYISEIIGKQDGTIYEKGLLDAASDEEFDALLQSLSTRRSKGHERQPQVSRTSPHTMRMSSRPRGHVADARMGDLRFYRELENTGQNCGENERCCEFLFVFWFVDNILTKCDVLLPIYVAENALKFDFRD